MSEHKTDRQQIVELIEREFDSFFEFDTEDRSLVTSVSCRLFAERVVELASIAPVGQEKDDRDYSDYDTSDPFTKIFVSSLKKQDRVDDLKDTIRALRASLTKANERVEELQAKLEVAQAWTSVKAYTAPQADKPDVWNTYTLYNQLLYAVARKYPGESRHETALRYIQECERLQFSGPQSKGKHEGLANNGEK